MRVRGVVLTVLIVTAACGRGSVGSRSSEPTENTASGVGQTSPSSIEPPCEDPPPLTITDHPGRYLLSWVGGTCDGGAIDGAGIFNWPEGMVLPTLHGTDPIAIKAAAFMEWARDRQRGH